MAKVQYRTLTAKQRRELEKIFIGLFKRLGLSEKGCALLFDLLTKSEIIMFARRIQIAQQLLSGKPFLDIAAELHVGLDTIQSVDRWLAEKLEDYRAVLRTLTQEDEDTTRKKLGPPAAHNPYGWYAMSRRYPAQFALFNLLLGIEIKKCHVKFTRLRRRPRA